MRSDPSSNPISVALVDDYDVVLIGLAHMFDHYRDRIVVAEIDANQPVTDDVDIVLYDSFAQPEADHDEIRVLIDNPHARRVVVYTWNFHPELIDNAMRQGGQRLPLQDPARPASWWPRSKPSMPARTWSARRRSKGATARSASTGRAAPKG